MSKYLNRGDAPFDSKVWRRIDEAVVTAAKGQLSGRKLLEVEGPYGLGVKFLTGPDVVSEEASPTISTSHVLPLVSIRQSFTLASRDIAAFEQYGSELDLGSAAKAAVDCARKEDELIFSGSKAIGADGILTSKGTQSVKLQPWTKIGAAADDVIQAATVLDDAGFHGPYRLGLSSKCYNMLFRRYPQGNSTEMDHIKSVVPGGVIKVPAMDSGGVLAATGRQYASIVIGQDLMTGFVGPTGSGYEFTVTESLALRLIEPAAICVLR